MKFLCFVSTLLAVASAFQQPATKTTPSHRNRQSTTVVHDGKANGKSHITLMSILGSSFVCCRGCLLGIRADGFVEVLRYVRKMKISG